MLILITIIDIIIGILISIFAFSLDVWIEILIGIGFGIGLLLIDGLIFFLVAIIITLPVKLSKRYPYSRFYERIFRNYQRFALLLFNVKIKVINKDKIPLENGIVICNHRSNLDSFVIDVVLKRRLLFAAKKSLFGIPWFGKLIWRNNYLYITRENAKNDFKELLYGADLINNSNYSVGIFPEGKRNFTEEPLLPFLQGYHILLKKTNKPLIIMSLKGTHEVNKLLFIKRHNVTLEVLDVIDSDKYNSMTKDELDLYSSNLIKESLKK